MPPQSSLLGGGRYGVNDFRMDNGSRGAPICGLDGHRHGVYFGAGRGGFLQRRSNWVRQQPDFGITKPGDLLSALAPDCVLQGSSNGLDVALHSFFRLGFYHHARQLFGA